MSTVHRVTWRRRHPSDRVVARSRWVTPFAALACAAVYLALVPLADPPAAGEYRHLVTVARTAVLAVYALGALVSLRFVIAGAGVMAFATAILGSLHASDHTTLSVFVVTVVFWLPSMVLWAEWQRRNRLALVLAVGGVFVAAFLVTGWGADRVHESFYGPSHPSSHVALEDVDLVRWAWVGGVDSGGATVTARLEPGAGSARLVVASDTGFDDAVASTSVDVDADDPVVQLRIDGLDPDSTYRFAVEVDGELDTGRRGGFTTHPDGPASFTFAAASCARVGTNGAVFDAIREADPLVFLQTGDLHYWDIVTPDPDKFTRAYDTLLAEPGPSLFFRRVPVAYVWDDHDFAGDGSDSTSAAGPTAQSAYRRYVPSYPLPADDTVNHAFTIGRVRFVVTDTRSARSPASAPDDADKTMLGADQREWFFAELDTAAEAGEFIVWVQSVPWIAAAEVGADHWGGYATERRLIADHIAELGVAERLLMVTGDAHMLALDDGTNSDYATDGGADFVVFHAAALDRPGEVKGGPYSAGAYPGGGQYGLVHVEDRGEDLVIRVEGRTWDGALLIDERFVVAVP